MKELYTSPEMKIVCFEACENLAFSISFSDLNTGNGGQIIQGSPQTGGTEVELP